MALRRDAAVPDIKVELVLTAAVPVVLLVVEATLFLSTSVSRTCSLCLDLYEGEPRRFELNVVVLTYYRAISVA